MHGLVNQVFSISDQPWLLFLIFFSGGGAIHYALGLRYGEALIFNTSLKRLVTQARLSQKPCVV
ncbi:hypothetical protein EDC14_103434 [Hydrogenispora ethanolica]|uniref:Uncharacterized protein n=1 Tax=Hydrogenispora ethanolica TaxID=1082276 RepID=A0A4R1R7D8_HYDET|nr:hypothetical protein [Hydrogenispora ethanolica]TCL61478.1 hypothetical protein EDC14_103434 [Hydrogenispora ethanolica]